MFIIQRFVAHPIGKLIEGTRAVSQMELDKPLNILHSSEELDDLAQSFDRMREQLQKAVAENNEFTQRLEIKVAERTRQLSAAHQKLLQSDRLASLGQLSASVAHEINNPISGVLNLTMLMQRMLKEDGVPANRLDEFRKYLGQVIAETSRVGRIVSDLLAFSRRSKPHRAPADLNQIVRTTLSVVAHKMKLNNVTVETRLAEGLPQVPCDQSQMQQVVLNLVLNAAEASQPKKGGHVLVSTQAASESVVMKVSDDGEGIQPENLSRIFDPFFTTKPEGKGVGLGLAVSFGIIQAHGGDIEVESKVGAGTTFTIILPLQQFSQPAEPGEVELARRE
jgi:two-component system NtrC family sensor kinase